MPEPKDAAASNPIIITALSGGSTVSEPVARFALAHTQPGGMRITPNFVVGFGPPPTPAIDNDDEDDELHVAYWTADDVAMLERAATKGVDYVDVDPTAYSDDE